MRKYIKEYLLEIEKCKDKKEIDNLKTKISFFQHERLIHLIVTLFFALFSIIFTCICFYTKNILLYVITIVLYIIDIFYIVHYYVLENGVQKLYKIFDKLNSK